MLRYFRQSQGRWAKFHQAWSFLACSSWLYLQPRYTNVIALVSIDTESI